MKFYLLLLFLTQSMLWAEEKPTVPLTSDVDTKKEAKDNEADLEITDDEALIKKSAANAKVICWKARGVLPQAHVFASRGIGAAGAPTSACWALTIIVKYDPDARDYFKHVFEHANTPVQRLYAIAGWAAIDRDEAREFFTPQRLERYAKDSVETLNGCISMTSTLEAEASLLLETDASSRYIFDRLPSFFRTVNVSPQK